MKNLKLLKKITIDDIPIYSLYLIAAQLYYLYYVDDIETFKADPDLCVDHIKEMFKEDNIDIKDLNQVDQYFAHERDLTEMSEYMVIINPENSYQFEVNWMLHHIQQLWDRWHT